MIKNQNQSFSMLHIKQVSTLMSACKGSDSIIRKTQQQNRTKTLTNAILAQLNTIYQETQRKKNPPLNKKLN